MVYAELYIGAARLVGIYPVVQPVSHVARDGERAVTFGEGTLPVAARKVCYRALVIVVVIGVLQPVLHYAAALRGGEEGRVHSVAVKGYSLVGRRPADIAFRRYGAVYLIQVAAVGALCLEYVVERVVCTVAYRKAVFGILYHPAARDVVVTVTFVVRGEILHIYGERERHRFAARFEHVRLAYGDQLHGALFHTVFFIVLSIGRLCIQLHRALCCDVARVLHLHVHRYGLVFVVGNKRFGQQPLGERAVREAVAKGINYLVGVVPAARGIPARARSAVCAAIAEHAVGIPRFIIVIARIYALRHYNVVVVVGMSKRAGVAPRKAARAVGRAGTEILCSRRSRGVGGIDIGQVARG